MTSAERQLSRRLLREATAARPALATVGALSVVLVAATIAQAALLADVLARAFVGRVGLSELRGELLALAAVLATRAVAGAATELSGHRAALSAMSQLRERLGRRLLVDRPGLSDGQRSGELATAAVQGVEALEAWFSRYLPQVMLSALLPVAIVVYGLTRDPAAAVVLALTVPVLIVFMVLVGLAAQGHARARWGALSTLGAHFADVVRELDVLRAHSREGAQAASLAAVCERYRVATMQTLRVAFLSALVLELVAMIGTALVAATVGLQLAAGHIGLSAGLCVLLLAPELYAPLRGVGQQFHASSDGLACAERLLAAIDEAPAVAPGRPGAAPDPSREPIVIGDVRFGYDPAAAPVLDGVSLVLAAGETVALTGASGSGKSTLAALVLRLADPDAGVIRCGTRDLRDCDAAAWHRRIAWVPQQPLVAAGTIADNVRLGREDAGDEAVGRALEQAGLAGVVAGLPDGPRTRVGDGGRPLSAGEAQRLALARAILRDAPLVILDEPTAHLDRATADDLRRALLEHCRGRTALLITHDEQLAAGADRQFSFDAGQLARPRLELVA